MTKYLPALFCLLYYSTVISAQVINDECGMAITLPEQLEFCTGPGGGSSVTSTTSLAPEDYGICTDNPEAIRDVWYAFVALRDAASITLRGNVQGNSVGTMQSPQFVVYENGCSALDRQSAIACAAPAPGISAVNVILTELTVGQTYHIAVGGSAGQTGTFELCLNQFTNPPSPESDCPEAVILCDKSPFSVEFLSGRGRIQEDLRTEGCVSADCSSRAVETNSSWYKWTCEQAGTLGFTITPRGVAPNEDLDFSVYELPNGLDDCDARQSLRCMYSGGNGSGSLISDEPCFGPTGLRAGESDNGESCGCSPGDNNFVDAIDMVAGRSYAMVIFNFSGSGDGFDIEFSGTGTFVGPEPSFSFSETDVCVGEALTFTDQSTSLDGIAAQEWDFGPTASPRFANGPGPHNVFFGEPGTPNVNLVITTNRNCREFFGRREVNVVCCENQITSNSAVTNETCPLDSTGGITLNASSSFSANDLSFAWSNGATTSSLSNLGQGTYSVTVTDASGCDAVFTETVGGPQPFTFDTLITMPECGGASNGALELAVTGGGTPPYAYSFNGNPFSVDNRTDDLPVSTINVRTRDAAGCLTEKDIFVDELRLGLVRGIDVFTEPICAGDANGSIEIQIANGQPDYRYDFGLGQGFQPSNRREGLAAGTYTVTAVDAEQCTGVFSIELTDPPAIDLQLPATNSTCFQTDDGQLTIVTSGGRPGYGYTLNGQTVTDTVFQNLVPGSYTIQLTDATGCVRSATTTLTEPAEIFPVLEETIDLACFEAPTGGFRLSATGGTPPYTYATDAGVFQADPRLTGLLAGSYLLYVQDANGCLDSLTGSIDQPEDFVIDVAAEARIILGFDTVLQALANYNPVSYVWLPGGGECIDNDCARIRVQPYNTTDYTVVGTNAAGCLDSATVKVNVIANLPTYIPNAFTPNGDGVNDGFTVFGGIAVESVEYLRVFSRWGELVFERANFPANDPTLGWQGLGSNGQSLNPAVFVYQARVRYLNGTTVDFSGDVSLIH